MRKKKLLYIYGIFIIGVGQLARCIYTTQPNKGGNFFSAMILLEFTSGFFLLFIFRGSGVRWKLFILGTSFKYEPYG